jgi:hypothetical protein
MPTLSDLLVSQGQQLHPTVVFTDHTQPNRSQTVLQEGRLGDHSAPEVGR